MATSHYPQPHLSESGLVCSPSRTHHPPCQRQHRIPSVDSGLGTSIAPAEIELGLFRELETDGSPAVDDAFREFSCDTTNNGYEVNRHMETNPVLDDGEH